jgi:hypothetical protein
MSVGLPKAAAILEGCGLGVSVRDFAYMIAFIGFAIFEGREIHSNWVLTLLALGLLIVGSRKRGFPRKEAQ